MFFRPYNHEKGHKNTQKTVFQRKFANLLYLVIKNSDLSVDYGQYANEMYNHIGDAMK